MTRGVTAVMLAKTSDIRKVNTHDEVKTTGNRACHRDTVAITDLKSLSLCSELVADSAVS